jgi:hypothetical protein
MHLRPAERSSKKTNLSEWQLHSTPRADNRCQHRIRLATPREHERTPRRVDWIEIASESWNMTCFRSPDGISHKSQRAGILLSFLPPDTGSYLDKNGTRSPTKSQIVSSMTCQNYTKVYANKYSFGVVWYQIESRSLK